MDNRRLQDPYLHDQPDYAPPSFVDPPEHRVANYFAGSYDANPFGKFSARPSQPACATPSAIARPGTRPDEAYWLPEQPLAHPAMLYPLQLEHPSPQSPLNSSSELAGIPTVPVGAQHPSATNPSQRTYAFISLAGSTIRKRRRRREDEIERLYSCSFEGCTKTYGTLNHLNAHVTMQKHGPKRHASEFKELRKLWRSKKKAEQLANRPHRDLAFRHDDTPHALSRTSRSVSNPGAGYSDDESDEETSQSDDSHRQEEHGVGQGSNSLHLPLPASSGRSRSRSSNFGH